ncbi:histidine phosphatase family protein [bacterium]|nr:histidine phosphatase family protein [bacterium]
MGKPVVIAVRHAESVHHVRGLSGGWIDTPLTDLGRKQALTVAQRLKREIAGPVRLYTSDLKRAAETAEPIAAAFGVEAAHDVRLREQSNGEALGLTIEEMLNRFPQQPFPHAPDHRPFPGGETAREFRARVSSFMEDLRTDDGVAILVTHGGTMRPLIAHWLGLSEETASTIGFPSHVTGITVLTEGWHGLREIERLNDIGHLAGIPGYVPIKS